MTEYERIREQAIKIIIGDTEPVYNATWLSALDKTIKILSLVEIRADDQDLTSYISFNLGLLQGEVGGLFENYPENFNLIMNKLGSKLREEGFVRVIPKGR